MKNTIMKIAAMVGLAERFAGTKAVETLVLDNPATLLSPDGNRKHNALCFGAAQSVALTSDNCTS